MRVAAFARNRAIAGDLGYPSARSGYFTPILVTDEVAD